MKLIYPVCIAAFLAVPSAVYANPIEQACLASDRGASRTLCACIGAAAETTLTQSQMRQGARWFTDPQDAQDTRQSDRRSDRALWQAWRRFGDAAEARCTADG